MARDPVLSSLYVEVVEARRTVLDRGWNRADYSDDVSRLYYTEEGEAFVRHHGNTYHLRPGRLMVVPAHSLISYWCPEHFIQHWVHFNATLFGGLALFDYLRCEYEVPVESHEETLSRFDRLRRVFRSGSPGERFETTGIMLQFLAPFAETVDADRHESLRREILRLREVLEYIDRHLGERITVDDLAAAAHLERTYFTRLFAANLGLPPGRFIRQKRIERAKRMLWASDDTLEAIAERLGFTDAFHFSRTFKHITGLSPKAFRTQPRGVP